MIPLGVTRKLGRAMVSLAIALTAVVVVANPASADPVKPMACPPEESYDNISYVSDVHYRIGPGYQDYNGTSNNATITLTATVGGTAGVSYTGSISAKVSVIVAEINVQTSMTVHASLTASVTNSIQLIARPHTSVYGDYGVWRKKTTGLYSIFYQSCNSNSAWITSWAPARVGWNTWGG